MSELSDNRGIIRLAMSGAAFSLAFQVAGKAARDALFLSNYRPRNLPLIIVAAAVSAILLSVIHSRLLSRFSPGRYIPALTAFSGLLQIAEWWTYRDVPRWTAAAVYIHVVALGAVVLSGFWSVINEQFDPRRAKQNFGRITAAGTVGGVAGGVLSERLGAMAAPESVLLAMGVAQLITAFLLLSFPRTPAPLRHQNLSAREVLKGSHYVRNVSLLVILGTFSAALLDYVLKSDARHALGPGEPLLRFFALFHTGTSLLSFVVQAAATPFFLSRLGLGTTVATLPASVAAGGAVAGVFGGLPVVVAVRGTEAVLRGSLFRAGYELLYTPMLPAEKRAVKSINDVAVDRLGDALGGGFAQVVITLFPVISGRVMLLTASAVSGVSWLLAGRLHAGYVKSIERSLSQSALEPGADKDAEDAVASLACPADQSTEDGLAALRMVPTAGLSSAASKRLSQLQSGDVKKVCSALKTGPLLERSLVAFVVPLLGVKDVSDCARAALASVAEDNVGQLSDWMLDGSVRAAVRCALPSVIATEGGVRAADALLYGLNESSSQVRSHCAHALELLRRGSRLNLESERIYSAVRGELKRLSQQAKAHPDLEHVAALLASVLPPEPVRIAFDALGTDDQNLRGLALEYLETTLPPDIGDTLIAIVSGDTMPEHLRRPEEVIRGELLRWKQHFASDPHTTGHGLTTEPSSARSVR